MKALDFALPAKCRCSDESLLPSGIDKSLIHDAAIVRAVVAMARELGMTTVAEGVETAPQYHMLQMCRCDEAQGYLFGRPMTAYSFNELFRARATASRQLPDRAGIA